jgi:flagellar export protein FliJ
MKPFRFRLTRLMHLKQAEKKQRAAELAHEQMQLRARESELASAERQEDAVRESYAGLAGRPAKASAWEGALNALGAAKKHVHKRQDVVHRAAEQVDAARERLVQKAREFETLERLRLRQWREHQLENQRSEQKENDEKAVIRFSREHHSNNTSN